MQHKLETIKQYSVLLFHVHIQKISYYVIIAIVYTPLQIWYWQWCNLIIKENTEQHKQDVAR